MRLPAVLLLATSLNVSLGSAASLRGVDPALTARYQPSSGKFTCFDRSRSLPVAQVNDNFCDCLDGSDEPGSSACANGIFYCRNRGHEPLRLNSSLVDDGVCDCCDGSDEPQGRCKSTCLEAGAELRKALRAQAAAYTAGAAKRAEYVQEASTKQAAWQAQLIKARATAKQQKRAVDRLQGEKDRVEAAEKAERDAADKVKQAAAEAKRKEQEAATAVEASKQEGDSESSPDSTEASSSDTADHARGPASSDAQQDAPEVDIVTGQDVAPGDTPAALDPDAEAKLRDDEAKQRLAQWVRDDAVPQAEPQDGDEGGVDEDLGDEGVDAVVPAAAAQEPAAVSTVQQPSGLWGRARAWAAGTLGRGGAAAPAVPADSRKATKDAFFAESQKLKEADKEVADLEARLKLDLGSEGQFAALHDRCFETRADKYTYSICVFGDAAQKDGSAHTRLGSWKGFADNYSTMRFEGGQGCWQGPARSLQVRVECGATEELGNVQEPNRCEYSAVFATPAACTPDLVAAAQQRLASREPADEHTEL